MNQKKRLNRRIILISLMLIVVCSVFSSQSMELTPTSVFHNESTQTPSNSAFSGSGKNFTITQHATAISSTYDVNPSTAAAFTLTNGWDAENISITAENVTRYRNLVQNGACDSNMVSYPDWTYTTTDSQRIPMDIQINRLSLDVGYTSITPNQIAYFYQNINIDEEEVSTEMVELAFDARMYNSPGESGLYLFGAVIIGGVEHNLTVDTTTETTDSYLTYSMQYYLDDVGQSLPNDIEFRFGVYVNQSLTYSGEHHDVHFDNIEYNVYTNVNQSYALVAQDQDDFTNYYFTNSSSGQGYFDISGLEKNYLVTQDVDFTISKNVSLIGTVNIEKLTISADLFKIKNTSYSSYQDGVFLSSDDILWSFDVNTTIPSGYLNRWFQVEKPTDWNIVSVVDPFVTNQTAQCLNVDKGSSSFIIPTSVYSTGIWQIGARSKSWFDESKLEFWDGDSFEEKTDFYIGEDFHVKVNINDTVTLANTYINFTVYYPNGTVFYEDSEEPSSFEYYFGNFTIGLNMTTGLYTAEVVWTNNQTPSEVDKVGYKTFDFGVFHDTQLNAVDTVIKTVPGEPLLILVNYEDTNTGEGIDLATVQYNSTYGDDGYLTYLGSGYYVLELNTTLYDYTDYFLSFNASKIYYRNQTESNLIQISIEREGMILDVPRQVNAVSANFYAQFNFNLTGEISEAFLTADDITTDWSAWYEITESVQGRYQLNVSTSGVTSSSFPETFIINIYANKTDYTNTTDIVLLQVNPIATSITANQTFVEASQGTPFTVKVNLTDIGLGSLVSGADCAVTWSLGTTITPIGDEFEIEYVTTGLAIDQYTSVITVNKSGYETKNVIISVLVNPVQTVIAANDTFIRISQGNQFTIKVNYTEYYGGALISGASCSVDWLKYYEISSVGDEFEILFNTTDLSLDQYTATIQINKTGYETKNVFVSVLVDPISTNINGNSTLITVEQGKVFSITANFTDFDTGSLISGAICTVTWGRDTNITVVSDEFIIDFDTSILSIGQYTGIIQIEKAGYETRSLFITVLIEPVSSDLNLLIAEPVEFFIGDQATISVEYIVDGLSYDGGTVTLVGDVEGTLAWNGTAYVYSFDTSSLDSKIYSTQIFAQAPGVQTQIYDLYIRIQPVELDIALSSNSIILTAGGSNTIYITVYDSSHGSFVTNSVILCEIDGVLGSISSLGNGTYTLDLDQFGLNQAVNPYSLFLNITNPNGDDETFHITVVVPLNWNLYWWIAGAVGGTILLGLSSLFIYFRYIKQTRFQRDIKFIKKNITNVSKLKSRSEPTRDKIVLDIINKEIDQLLK